MGIELAALRQSLWRYYGRTALDARVQDEPPKFPTDKCRWIDTKVMPCDPLTKSMSDEFLQDILDTNMWDYAQPDYSKAEKQRKQDQRRTKKADKAPGSEPRSVTPEAVRSVTPDAVDAVFPVTWDPAFICAATAGSSSFGTPSRTPWEGDFDDEGNA